MSVIYRKIYNDFEFKIRLGIKYQYNGSKEYPAVLRLQTI
jgi:hypothetical protein